MQDTDIETGFCLCGTVSTETDVRELLNLVVFKQIFPIFATISVLYVSRISCFNSFSYFSYYV